MDSEDKTIERMLGMLERTNNETGIAGVVGLLRFWTRQFTAPEDQYGKHLTDAEVQELAQGIINAGKEGSFAVVAYLIAQAEKLDKAYKVGNL